MALPWEPPSPRIVPTIKKKPVGAKPVLLPSLEGSLGIGGLPRVTPPTAPLGVSSGGGVLGVAPTTNTISTVPPNNPALGDFGKLIEGDYMYGPAQTQYQNALNTGWQNLVQNPFRQAQIAYGDLDINQVPEQYRELVRGILNDTTLAEAHENPTSTMALLTQALNRGRAAIPYQAAARGATRSGGNLVTGRRLNESYQLQGQQALQSLLSTLLQGQTSYGELASSAGKNFNDMLNSIVERLSQQPGPGDPDLGSGLGREVPFATDDDLYSPSTYPHLNAAVPSQVYTPVHIGSGTSFEPRPTAGNYIPQAGLSPVQKAAAAAAKKAAQKAAQMARGLF